MPFSDIDCTPINFILAKKNSQIIGCIGIEQYETEGLLRSFAIDRQYQKKGFGKELINRLLAYAVQQEINTLHLLTNTASEYFGKIGFKTQDRDKAPDAIKKTTEFTSLCPSTSVYMILSEISNYALYFDHHFMNQKTDNTNNSKFWSVKGKQMMFTHFEVPSKTRFEEHSHISEQITYMISGELVFKIKDQVFRLVQGDTIVVPSGVPHSVWSDTGAIAVDAWTPINEQYL